MISVVTYGNRCKNAAQNDEITQLRKKLIISQFELENIA